MQKTNTLFVAILMATLFFSSCKKNEVDAPIKEISCATLKDWTDNAGVRFLLNEYAFDGNKLAKEITFKTDGKKKESLFEYDTQGRLSKISDKIDGDGAAAPIQYVTTFTYGANEKLYRTDTYKVEDGNNSLVQVRILHYLDDKVFKLVSSAGVHWRYEYNDAGNVIKTFHKPDDATDEYLQEEFTSYDDKLLNKTLEEPLILQNISIFSTGSNFSKNNVVAYKMYNQDGSIKFTSDYTREYNLNGNQTKLVTTTTTNGTTTSTTVDTEYPTCK